MNTKDRIPKELWVRWQVNNINNIVDFFTFVEQYNTDKVDRKTYAFCFYTFLEKLILTSSTFAPEFINVCKQKQVGDAIINIMTNMLNNSKKVNNMSNLIKVGYWKSAEELNLPDPTTLPQIDPTVKHFVLEYLKTKAKVHTAWKGCSYCRFNCGINPFKMGSCCMTDGTYMWPEGLTHYIEEHNVSPGLDFINHVMKNLKK